MDYRSSLSRIKPNAVWLGVMCFVLSLIIFESCKHDSISSSAEICFDSQIQPIIISNCAYSGCHDAASRREGVDLSNYDKIMATGGVEPGNANKSKLYKVLNSRGEEQMPPSGKLDDADIQMIFDWIEQGAENLICDTAACDTTNASFMSAILPITNSFCKSCHGSINPSGGISLTNFANISVAAANGSLVGSINGTNGYQKMPQGSALNDCQISLIEKWVREGALDN